MTSRHTGSSHSRSSSTHSRESSLIESDNEDHDDLLARAVAADRSRRSQRSTRNSASLHDLELMGAHNNSFRPSDATLSFAEEVSEISTQTRRTTNTSTLGGTLTSSAHLRFVLEEDDHPNERSTAQLASSSNALDASSGDHSATSAYSEYSEYEEDEFDPEWHARQNQQAAMALLAKTGPRQSNTDGGTEKTRSIRSGSDMESISEAPSDNAGSSQIFANRKDLREVDQSVNLMDASVGNYDAPEQPRGQSSRRSGGRKGRKQQHRDSLTSNFLAAAQNSLVDVFLDTSDGKMPSFRRSMSRGSAGGSGSLRLNQANAGAGTHQRRLFYGHSPPPPPTIRERGGYFWCGDLFSLENCCKLVIILFVMVFVIIMALPQGMWWIQEQLGLVNDKGEPLVQAPSLPFPPLMNEEAARLAALHEMILHHELTSKADLSDKGSPQYQATVWLAQHDPANLTLVRSDDKGGPIVEPHKILNRYALATFYIAMNGPQRDRESNEIVWNETRWHINEDWMSGKHICDWYGIECEGPNHIEHFNLTHNRLKGSIPSELSQLTDLILVDWSHNQVTGPLPDFVGTKWLDLEFLILTKNELEGTLPATIGNLTHLQELLLSTTNLQGSIPKEINNMTSLRILKLDHNSFDKEIPSLDNLVPSLEFLNLNTNLLTGNVPPSIFQLTNLVGLELDHNSLHGTIASEIGVFHNLEAFTISNNNITGLMPDVWTGTPNLVEFEVNNNHLRGTIPPSLATLTDLEFLTLDDNPITGTIPTEFGRLENLVVFQAYHTELVGSMPEEICSLEAQRGVDLIVFADCDDGHFHCQCCDRCF